MGFRKRYSIRQRCGKRGSHCDRLEEAGRKEGCAGGSKEQAALGAEGSSGSRYRLRVTMILSQDVNYNSWKCDNLDSLTFEKRA